MYSFSIIKAHNLSFIAYYHTVYVLYATQMCIYICNKLCFYVSNHKLMSFIINEYIKKKISKLVVTAKTCFKGAQQS